MLEKKKNKKQILFICIGNTCRSFIAGEILNYLNSNFYDVYSCGINANNSKVSKLAIEVLKQNKIKNKKKISDNISKYKNKFFNTIIILDKNIDSNMLENFNISTTNLYRNNIKDPMDYIEEKNIYGKTFNILEEYIKSLTI